MSPAERCRQPLLRFLVQLMLVATGAVLLPLDALWVQALVLHGEVIAILALAAGEDDLLAGHLGLSLGVVSPRPGTALSGSRQPGLPCPASRRPLARWWMNCCRAVGEQVCR